MKAAACVTAVALLCIGSSCAFARDEYMMLSISQTIKSPEAQALVHGRIKLFFARQGHPQVLKDIGDRQITKKTRAVGKGDQAACVQAFFGALFELQELAEKEGGNAVVDIHSDYKDVPATNESQYVCGTGLVTARVVLTGRVVRLGQKQ